MPIVIKFFDEHLLITKKHADYLLFKLAVNLVLNKKHLKKNGKNGILIKNDILYPENVSGYDYNNQKYNKNKSRNNN